MSKISLKLIEIENYGRFYDTAALNFDSRISMIALGSGAGKSTFVNALEQLSDAVIDGKINYNAMNYCRTFVNKPKGFCRVEILLEILDSSHNGVYRYGIKVTPQGIISEYLVKESTQRRVFYRYKNDLELYGYNDEVVQSVKSSVTSEIPMLHLFSGAGCGIEAHFITFFQRLWIVRSGGLSNRISASHLFKTSFFGRRSNVEKCCSFLRLYDKKVMDMIRVAGTSKVMVIKRNPDGYDYPVPLSYASDTLIKYLMLYRAIDALHTYGGTVIMDVGDFLITDKLVNYLNTADMDLVNFIFVSDNVNSGKTQDISLVVLSESNIQK